MKSKLVILDANVIIDLHRLGLWAHFLAHFDVCVPSVVLHDEAHYFTSASGQQSINLQADIQAGRVRELEATLEDFSKLQAQVKPSLLQAIDPGETEAIALLNSGRFEGYRFCTVDGRAIVTLSILDLSTTYGVSLELLLQESGRSMKDIPPFYSEQTFQKRTAEGFLQRDLYKK